MLFWVPVALIVLIVLVALLEATGSNGTLVVGAETSSRYYPARGLAASAAVQGVTQTTPFNLTLAPGQYTVQFSPVAGFVTPSAHQVTVTRGRTSYVTAVYQPVVQYVGDPGGLFNTSSVQAIHDVTPVTWVNNRSSYFVILIQPLGRIVLDPYQNFTHVFTKPGDYAYATFSGNSTGSVHVT